MTNMNMNNANVITLKVGTFPGTLTEMAIASGTKVSEVLDMAQLDIGSESEVKLDGNVVSMDTTITSGQLLLITKRLKGAMNMTTIKIGNFPGSVNEYAVENGTTVAQALELAGLEVGTESEVKLDGQAVSMNSTVDGGHLLLITKRLKGAMDGVLSLKVGTFPGSLTEYAMPVGTTVREALDMAGLEVGAETEIKLDGNVVGLDTPITSGQLLLLTKRLKGATK